jgi:hypothetical protein
MRGRANTARPTTKLAWLTGFDGSAGVALVLKDKALLFVDGRYQAGPRSGESGRD